MQHNNTQSLKPDIFSIWHSDEQVSRVASEHLGKPVTVAHYKPDQKTGPCPFCAHLPDGADENGFVIFKRGNYWCRKCDMAGRPNAKGWWLPDDYTPQDRNVFREELEKQRQLTRDQAIAELRSPDTIAEIASYTQDTRRFDIWMGWGFSEPEIKKWGLGFCKSSPTARDIPTGTIPVLLENQYIDIRHRLIEESEEGGKYRSHLPGLRPFFFNADVAFSAKTLHVAEGEKKGIILQRAVGPYTIAYPGIKILSLWPELFDLVKKRHPAIPFHEVIFYPDPGTIDEVARYGIQIARLGIKVKIAELIDKPDDMIIDYGVDAFMQELRFCMMTL